MENSSDKRSSFRLMSELKQSNHGLNRSDHHRIKRIDLATQNERLQQLIDLPRELWPKPHRRSDVKFDSTQDDISADELSTYLKNKIWEWPNKNIFFFCDQHADADAFILSLMASGGILKTGDQDHDLELTPLGLSSLFIIGGDCFDKGPDNLRLLDVIKVLIDARAKVKLLCGNHDLRTYLGIHYAERKEDHLDHLFIRMGKKTVPLIKEIYDRYVAPFPLPDLGSIDELRKKLFPSPSWYENFPNVARPYILEKKIQKELLRMKEKEIEFEERCKSFGLTPAMTFATILKFKELFFSERGKYAWFFKNMELAYRNGSTLFVHAGVDDVVAKLLLDHGCHALNRSFHQTLAENPFALYHGHLGNVFRTKYRDFDHLLTEEGTQHLRDAGIHLIVHGHRNVLRGQRMVIRKGILNFE
jgi:hypothetical protein